MQTHQSNPFVNIVVEEEPVENLGNESHQRLSPHDLAPLAMIADEDRAGHFWYEKQQQKNLKNCSISDVSIM